MTEPRWWIVGIAALYLALSLGIGLFSGRKGSASTEAWVAGDRTLGLFVMYFITGATVFSAFAFLGLPGWAYSRGAACFYTLGYGALGLLPFYFLGARAARIGRARGFVTQAQMVSERFESRTMAGLMVLVSALAFIPYLALQMKGAAMVIAVVTDGYVPEPIGALVVYSIVLIYVMKSGVLGVGWTNAFQGLFMLALAWGLGIYLPVARFGSIESMFRTIDAARPGFLLAPGLAAGGGPWSFAEYSSAVVVSTIGFSAWPHLFMKAFTAKSVGTIRWTVILFPTFQVFLLPLLLIGFAAVGMQPAPSSPDRVLPHLLTHTAANPLLVGLFCAGALAASMSTGDAMAHAVSSITIRDGWIATLKRSLSPERELKAIRIALLAYMAASYVFAISYRGSLVVLLLSAYGAIVQFMPILVATLYVPRVPKAAAIGGLAAGSLLALVLTVWPDLRPFPIHAGLYGLVLNVTVMFALSVRARARPAAVDFVEEAAGRPRQ